ncbi:DNA polymerase alpha, subunit B [Hymenopellis radicata]|nr:DNA polymerase alpha, subunit B [Hymenopellis radicata]
MSSKEEILDRFGDDLDEKLIEECINMCKIYELSPEDLFYKWEATTANFYTPFKTQARRPFDMDAVVTLKQSLQRELTDKRKQVPKTKRLVGAHVMSTANRMPNFLNRRPGNSSTPARGVQMKSEDVEMDMGLGIPSVPDAKVVFKGPSDDAATRKSRSYRYMFEKVLERSEVLDTQIENFRNLIEQHYGIELNSDPASITDEEVVVVGRITQDTEQSTSSKLDESTLLIDTARSMGSGKHMVPIRFDQSVKIRGGAKGSGGLGVFPGALVALKGKNGGGGWFSVTEFLAPPPLRTRSTAKSDPASMDASFSVCICSGPYTSDSDLTFKPWKTLLSAIKSKKPTVVVLIGPFLDATHKSLEAGAVDSTPLQLFQKQFINPLKSMLDESPGHIAILVPNVRDLVSAHAVFPQAEFETEVTNGDPRIHLVPNPAHFTINDIKFGVTSADVMYHMKTQELTIQGVEVDPIVPQFSEDVDGMANTCRHLLQQRSFYPVFPVPLEESRDINLDITHSAGLTMVVDGEYAPDVLVVPSRLRQFVKNLDGTIAINPSSCVKGALAMIDVVPGNSSVRERIRAKADKIENFSEVAT